MSLMKEVDESKRVVYFDIASALEGDRQSWSPNTLKTRLILNYKRLPYISCYISYPDIAPLLQSLSCEPPKDGRYTLPAIYHPSSLASVAPGGKVLRDSLPIAHHLEKTFPEHPIFPEVGGDGGKLAESMAIAVQAIIVTVQMEVFRTIIPQIPAILDPRGKEYFIRTREADLGPLGEVKVADEKKSWGLITMRLSKLCEMLALHQSDGSGEFFMGKTASYADFVVVAFLGWFERGDRGMFEKMVKVKGGELGRLWEACKPWVDGQGEVREWVVEKDGEVKKSVL